MSEDPPLLEVRDLAKHYTITEGILKREVGRVRAVDGISFSVRRGETLGIVGESGCGKSTAATSLLRLDEPTGGEVLFEGEDILEYDTRQLRRFRRRAQMIFQDPTSSFDPRMTVGQSIAEPLVIHGFGDAERRRRVVKDLLGRVGMSPDDVDRYPHEFSGGQKQRIALARAMVVNPSLLVADEPTSALDVSIQAEILSLVEEMQAAHDLGIIFISHDMSVIREVCDRVAVMYLGEIVELAPTEKLFERPAHPYTRALLGSIPRPDPRQRGLGVELSGDVPSPSDPPSGCRFHTRCPEVIPPEEYALGRAEWRGVMDLRDRLQRDRVDLEAAREFVVAEHDADSVEAVTDDQLRAVVREEFDLKDPLTDGAAEERLREGMDHLVDGDLGAARDHLASAFPTVCEREAPALVEVGEDGGRAACHRNEEEYESRVVGTTAGEAQADAGTDADVDVDADAADDD